MFRIVSNIGLVALVLIGVFGCNTQRLYPPYEGTTYIKNGGYYCELHDVRLKRGIVPIEYGFIPYFQSRRYTDPEMMQFPNANSFDLGGCCTMPDSPSRAWTWYCVQCRRAEEQWSETPEGASDHDHPSIYSGLDDPAEILSLALKQTDYDAIRDGLDMLRHGVRSSEGRDPQRWAHAYVQLVRKLEGGWPGYVGVIVSIKGKVPRRSSEADALSRQYGLAGFEASLYWDPALVELHRRVEPAASGQTSHAHWLGAGTRDSLPWFEADRNRAPRERVDADAWRYVEDCGSIQGVPVRRITLKQPESQDCSIVTWLLDDSRYPARELLEAHRKFWMH